LRAKLMGVSESAGKEGKKTRQLNPCPQAARGVKWEGQSGGHVPKTHDSNGAVGVRDRATGKALKGADRLYTHYSKISIKCGR